MNPDMKYYQFTNPKRKVKQEKKHIVFSFSTGFLL